MIAQYESGDRTPDLDAPRIYGLDLNHKHIPEMMDVTGLETRPVFCPVVDNYYAGMATTVAIHNRFLRGAATASSVRDALAGWYADCRFIKVDEKPGAGMLEANACVGTNEARITVSGDDALTIITARFDNLGKGASGAAVQNMNIMLGFDEASGLV